MPRVAIVIGSESDRPYLEGAVEVLTQFGVEHEVRVHSAHRTPEVARQFALQARSRGVEVIIAAAGYAAHLPGVLAGWTPVPVIGVPLPTSDLKGLDSLYAIVQMPPGVPVATMGIGRAGARNAALFAAQMLAIADPELRRKYEEYKQQLAG
jgi:5-(carboxyamino)imidazole ribonucleotide mutase